MLLLLAQLFITATKKQDYTSDPVFFCGCEKHEPHSSNSGKQDTEEGGGKISRNAGFSKRVLEWSAGFCPASAGEWGAEVDGEWK